MRVEAVRTLALSLPETAEAPHFEAASFRVRGKIFATLPPGGTHVHVFVPEEVRAPALALHPSAMEPLRWGHRVLGLRLALEAVDAATVEALLRAAWRHKAPRRMAATGDGS